MDPSGPISAFSLPQRLQWTLLALPESHTTAQLELAESWIEEPLDPGIHIQANRRAGQVDVGAGAGADAELGIDVIAVSQRRATQDERMD